jgi:hypothetical protein
MLLGFELFGFGVSIDSPSFPLLFHDLSLSSLTFAGPSSDFRPSGIVLELLQVPLIANSSFHRSENLDLNDLSLDLFVAPILASFLAYFVIAIGFRVSLATTLPTEVKEVIPQKIFCFQSIYLPEIRLSPPRTTDLPDFKRAELWQTATEKMEIGRIEAVRAFSRYLPPGADLEGFAPVPIPAENGRIMTRKSLFSV